MRRAPVRRAASIARRVPPTFTRVNSSNESWEATSAAAWMIASTPCDARCHVFESVTSPTIASAPKASTTARERSRTRARAGGCARRDRSASSTWVPTSPAAPVTRTLTRGRRAARRRAGPPPGPRAQPPAPRRQPAPRAARWRGRPSARAPTRRRRRGRIGLEQQSAELAVGMPPDMQAAHRLLAGIAALGIRHATDFIEAHFLRDRFLVDLRAEPRPPREDARQLQRLRRGVMRAGRTQPCAHRVALVRCETDLEDEGRLRRIAGPRDLYRHTTHRSFDGVARPLRDRDACRAHHRNGVRPRDTQHRGFVRTIGGPREPRRDRALQDQHRALATLRRHGEPHPRPRARRPAIDRGPLRNAPRA